MTSNANGGGLAPKSAADDVALAREAIGRLDFFRSERPGEPVVTQLGGLTNHVFKVECNGDAYALRLPGKGTEDYIDRDFESVAVREAARVGVSPEIVVSDPVTGILVMQYLNATTMSARMFKMSPGAPARAGEVLKRLHTSNAKFKFKFDLFGMIDEYRRVLSAKPVKLPDGFQIVLRDADQVRRALAAKPAALTACHCDPLADNFLDSGRRMWLVDWEYSGMNDPLWDLGDVFVEAGFDAKQEAELMASYFGGEPTANQRGRIVAYKSMCDLLWTLWGLIQHANNNPADDFWAYANKRLDRCKALMSDASFAAHMTAVANG